MMKMPAPWGVLTVKADIGDAILCVQKLNLVIAVTSKEHKRQMLLHSRGRRAPGSASASPKQAHFKEDPNLTKKVALTIHGSRFVTVGACITDK